MASIHKEQLFNALSSGKEGFKLSNVKFFLGDDRNISQDKLCKEACEALDQVKMGLVKAKDFSEENNSKISIDQFLK